MATCLWTEEIESSQNYPWNFKKTIDISAWTLYNNIRRTEELWRGVRVVYGAGLENQWSRKGPRVRISSSPPYFQNMACRVLNRRFCFTTLSNRENFTFGEIPKWWRGSPAKGVGCESAARVQIPLSPPKNPEGYAFGIFSAEGFSPMRRRFSPLCCKNLPYPT